MPLDLSSLPLILIIIALLIVMAFGIPWVGQYLKVDGAQGRGLFAVLAFGALIVLGLAAVAAYPFSTEYRFNGIAVLFLAAMSVIGFAVGFLFSLPQVVQSNPPTQLIPSNPPMPSQPVTPVPERELIYRTNSSLEQIADWLTKIIVGVGLTQLPSAGENLRNLGAYFGPILGGDAATSERTAVIILLYALVCGFLLGYFWTRLFLSSAFKWADTKLVRDISEELKKIR